MIFFFMNALFDRISCQTPLILLPSSWKLIYNYFLGYLQHRDAIFYLMPLSHDRKFASVRFISFANVRIARNTVRIRPGWKTAKSSNYTSQNTLV